MLLTVSDICYRVVWTCFWERAILRVIHKIRETLIHKIMLTCEMEESSPKPSSFTKS